MRKLACAFSGHRPQKFPWRYNENADGCIKLKELLRTNIIQLIDGGVTDFLSGMAEGTDTWASQIVLSLRNERAEIKLHCILPCKGQDAKWTVYAKETYRGILEQADSIIYTNRIYHKDCMLERNRFLVDHSSLLLAVYNGEPRGGTAATIRYARKSGREIYILNPVTLQTVHEDGKQNLTPT